VTLTTVPAGPEAGVTVDTKVNTAVNVPLHKGHWLDEVVSVAATSICVIAVPPLPRF